MNSQRTRGGLSARRKILPNFQIQYRLSSLIVLAAILTSSCQERVNDAQSVTKDESKISLSTNRYAPSINGQVNKSYANNGFGFDSTFNSVYSSVRGDSSSVGNLMKNFWHGNPSFDHPIGLLRDQIFHDEFFMKPDKANDYYLRYLMQRMDTTKKDLEAQHRQKNQYTKNRNS